MPNNFEGLTDDDNQVLTTFTKPEDQAQYLSKKYGESISIAQPKDGSIAVAPAGSDYNKSPEQFYNLSRTAKPSLLETIMRGIATANQPMPGVGPEEAKAMGEKALDLAPAGVGMAGMTFAPEGAGWWLPLIGAGLQGGTKVATNAIQGKPLGEDVKSNTAEGALGGTLGVGAGYLGKLAGKIASTIGESPATKELAEGLAARVKTPSFNVGPFRFGGQPIVKEVGPEVSNVIDQSLHNASTVTTPDIANILKGGVKFEDAPEAWNAAMARRQNTIDAIAKLKGTSPEKFVEADLLPSQTMDISKDITQPLTDLQKSVMNLGERNNLLGGIGKKVGRATAPGLANYLSDQLGKTQAFKDANAKIDATYR